MSDPRLSHGRSAERGFVLVSTLLVLLLLSMALALAATALASAIHETAWEERNLRLMALTDAALAEGLARFAADLTTTRIAPHAYGGGTIGSRVETILGDGWRVIGEATYEGRSRTVEVELRLTDTGWVVSRWRRRSG